MAQGNENQNPQLNCGAGQGGCDPGRTCVYTLPIEQCDYNKEGTDCKGLCVEETYPDVHHDPGERRDDADSGCGTWSSSTGKQPLDTDPHCIIPGGDVRILSYSLNARCYCKFYTEPDCQTPPGDASQVHTVHGPQDGDLGNAYTSYRMASPELHGGPALI
ncbi:hypothetical protein K491DRAFT_677894 [Lophiostoma macrostomum CBS 122681]|uniref:Uncharacterized protein n=1 Tax=Lophiostoma macrostomum CBS 122681 TaxID=1314788 RepID=A0A6A6TBG0_9PLEO|nr:hypothetical protein K491DRAFT_677894 [Lophiostoma macrostomum CBS 122681]